MQGFGGFGFPGVGGPPGWPPAFPGGTALRGPLHVLGMLWYALRDRIG